MSPFCYGVNISVDDVSKTNVSKVYNILESNIGLFMFNINRLWFMVFNATFNNILVIWRRFVLLVEETGVPGENHRLVESH